MLSHVAFTLVNCLLITLSSAIRVDWNTNKGPIVPPTPRTTIRPLPPYRAPAPVWEDQSNDIPNPKPYVYILPPPSRPRTTNNNNNNYVNSDWQQQPATPPLNYYGNILLGNDIEAYIDNGNGNVVGSLSPKYVANVGLKYTAVVPPSNTANTDNNNKNKNYRNAAAGGSVGYFNNDKLQGKFNAKTKKYKAYEKVKYVPLNYYPTFLELALPAAKPYQPVFNQAKLIVTQQLPLEQAPPSFRPMPASAATDVVSTTTNAANAVAPATATGTAAAITATTATTELKSQPRPEPQVNAKLMPSATKLSPKSSAVDAKHSAQMPNALHRR